MTIRDSIKQMIDTVIARGGVPDVEHVGPRKASWLGLGRRKVCDVCSAMTDQTIAYRMLSTNVTILTCMPCAVRINHLGVDMATRDAYIESIGEDAAFMLGVYPIPVPEWLDDAIERAVRRAAGHGD